MACHHVMDADVCEHLWRTLCLIGLHSNFISGHLLVKLLPQHGNDVERRAASESDRDQLNRFGTCAASRVVEHHVVSAAGCSYELTIRFQSLGKRDFSGDHFGPFLTPMFWSD